MTAIYLLRFLMTLASQLILSHSILGGAHVPPHLTFLYVVSIPNNNITIAGSDTCTLLSIEYSQRKARGMVRRVGDYIWRSLCRKLK